MTKFRYFCTTCEESEPKKFYPDRLKKCKSCHHKDNVARRNARARQANPPLSKSEIAERASGIGDKIREELRLKKEAMYGRPS